MSTANAIEQFDICGPLPEGVTVLEASAGTGKTYTIAALAARYVAEGIPLERMLLITFTRMATGELRDRVRERLVGCEQHLAQILKGAVDPGADALLTLLGTGTREQVELRRDRLAMAVADFDAATIATTHGFCQEVLAELGTVGDLEPGTMFVEDVYGLLEETLDDLYVRRFHPRGGVLFDRAQALKIVTAAVFNPMAELEPRQAPQQTAAAMRCRLADRVRVELELRKRRLAIMTYDDLLTRLNQTLAGPNGPLARERLRARFDVVLVDEFQDTDPIQWQILHRAFGQEEMALVLIADPKQAIYAFRGADVYAYLVAAATASKRATLQVNRRSDQPLLDAYDALFEDARLGHEGIVYRRVRAADHNQTSRLLGAPSNAPLRIRLVDRNDVELTYNGYAQVQAAREHVAADLAADVVRLLSSGAEIEHRAPDGTVTRRTEVQPGDVAVLVRTNYGAELIRDELHAARVPAVINGAGSVFATEAAHDWLALLAAIERPSSTTRARTAALTAFFDWNAEQLAGSNPEKFEEIHRRLHRWSRILRDSGVAALTEAIMIGEDLPARMLQLVGGERQLTDVRHLSQLLHGIATAEQLGVAALRAWLAQSIRAVDTEKAEEEQTRRLESDADAVQVLTVHRSKGLEFPIVYCPFLWEPGRAVREGEPVSFHDPDRGDQLTLDVGLDGPGFAAHARQHMIEQRGEDLRLAYVALTRAKHQAVIWWAGSRDSGRSPLTRLLFSRDPDGNVAAFGGSTPTDSAAETRFLQLAEQAPGRIAVERAGFVGLPSSWSPPLDLTEELVAATFDRQLDLRWRRTSFSDLTAETHDPLVTSEPEEPVLEDEPDTTTPVPERPAESADPALAQPSLFAELPAGTEFGTFVHSVLEAADFAAPDLAGEIAEHVATAQAWRSVELGDPAQAIEGLRATIETPLGESVNGIRLRDLDRQDRLGELAFELPLVGGDDPSGRLTLRAIAAVLREHLPAHDPLAGYAERLSDPALRSTVRGFLTGSIDLVMRLDGPRFAIVDYKTNWLGPFDEPLTLRHYAPAALATEMIRAHYGLQALLYTVALHRYLRWRLAGYDPNRHFAGVLYLFLRGMAGADTPAIDGSPCGVFTWRPSGPLVHALSEVLDRGAA